MSCNCENRTSVTENQNRNISLRHVFASYNIHEISNTKSVGSLRSSSIFAATTRLPIRWVFFILPYILSYIANLPFPIIDMTKNRSTVQRTKRNEQIHLRSTISFLTNSRSFINLCHRADVSQGFLFATRCAKFKNLYRQWIVPRTRNRSRELINRNDQVAASILVTFP